MNNSFFELKQQPYIALNFTLNQNIQVKSNIYIFSPGNDVCVDLNCSPHATCRKELKKDGKFQCDCLPELVGDGRNCTYKQDVVDEFPDDVGEYIQFIL